MKPDHSTHEFKNVVLHNKEDAQKYLVQIVNLLQHLYDKNDDFAKNANTPLNSDVYGKNKSCPEMFILNQISGDSFINVLLCDDKLCAVSLVDVECSGDVYNLNKFIIHPDYQGKGIGSYFFDYCTEQAKLMQCNKFTLTVHKGNEIAQELYFKKGFSEVSKNLVLKF